MIQIAANATDGKSGTNGISTTKVARIIECPRRACDAIESGELLIRTKEEAGGSVGIGDRQIRTFLDVSGRSKLGIATRHLAADRPMEDRNGRQNLEAAVNFFD